MARPLTARFLLFFALAIALSAYVRLFRNALIDDTFITLVYVRNLIESFSWGFFAGEPMNTATSPLNVIALAAVTLIVRDPVRAVFCYTVIVWLASIYVLSRISRRLFGRQFFTVCCAALLLFNPLLVSTIGLESWLYIFLFLVSLDLFIRRQWDGLAAVSALLTLARTEGVLAAAVFWLFIPGFKTKARFVLIYAAMLLPWHLFAWTRLGSFFPETLFIKASQKTFSGYGFLTGILLFIKTQPIAMAGALMPAALAIMPLSIRHPRVRRVALAVLIYGALHFIGYSALRVPPYHWYYTSTIMCCILLAAFRLAEFRRKNRHARFAMNYVIVAPVLMLALCFIRAGRLTPDEMPVFTNWMTCAQYQAMAGELVRDIPPGEPIRCDIELGTLEYYSRLDLRNEFSDRRMMRDVIDRILKPHGLKLLITKFNFYWRTDPPPKLVHYRLVLNPKVPTVKSWPVFNVWLTTSIGLIDDFSSDKR